MDIAQPMTSKKSFYLWQVKNLNLVVKKKKKKAIINSKEIIIQIILIVKLSIT